jgi:membrane protein required for colicin V production
MSAFDAIVVGLTLLAAVMGYRAGLLRSLATILGYVIAAPLAVAAAPAASKLLPARFGAMGGEFGLVFFVVFLLLGIALGAMLRASLVAVAGETINLPDRAGGAVLGAVRILLVAVLMVLIFERIIPPNKMPPWLSESNLRPHLANAAEMGVRSLPSDVTAYIDNLKRERGL